jgi:peroxiredoxin Q/BCP
MNTKPAPPFNLQGQDGKQHSLADYAGKWLVLYLYPKDDTPGCTAEACAFRDAHEAIAALPGVEVIGVSTDTVASHRRFAEKHQLTFTLLSDPNHSLIGDYGAWKLRKLAGHEYMGTNRSTFVINPEGQIIKTYEDVHPDAHVAQVLDDLVQLIDHKRSK